MNVAKFICKHFGHKWQYAFDIILSRRDVRVCKRCGAIEMYLVNVPVLGSSWFGLVRYTDKGAKEHYEKVGIKL
jgi:hypothetical protein